MQKAKHVVVPGCACCMQICPYPNTTFKPLFSSKKPTNSRKSSKVVQTQSWLLVATLGKFFVPFLLPCGIPYHHASSEQSKDNVTCFLLPCGIPCTMHHAPMHHPSKAKPMSHAFASMWHTMMHYASSEQSKG